MPSHPTKIVGCANYISSALVSGPDAPMARVMLPMESFSGLHRRSLSNVEGRSAWLQVTAKALLQHFRRSTARRLLKFRVKRPCWTVIGIGIADFENALQLHEIKVTRGHIARKAGTRRVGGQLDSITALDGQ